MNSRSEINVSKPGSWWSERLPTSLGGTWEELADIRRGDGTGGILVRNRETQIFRLWSSAIGFQSLPQDDPAITLAIAGF